jgi:tetratricopeptide (TPR) repeat protein
MTRKALGLAAVLVVGAALFTVAVAQSRRPSAPNPPQTPAQLAMRALVEGRYDDIAALTEKDQFDPTLVAIRARADIERGKYEQAEALLRPATQRQPVSDAALELGLLLKMLSRPEGTQILTRLAATAETADRAADLARAARALRALGRFNESNAAYRDAAAAAPRDLAIQAAWGDMFLEGRCQTCNADATKSFQAVLKDEPRWAPALVGMAEAIVDEDPPQALGFAKKALEINPSSVPALLFIATGEADAGHRDAARESIKKALEVNPSSLDGHAQLAALAYIEDRQQEFEAEVAKVLALSPKYSEVYRLTGELAAHNYRFDEAVTLVRKGLALDPGNAQSLADLGTHLLRTGDETAARQALEGAFTLHPYDVVSFNLLQMMDTLDKFVTVRDGEFIIRMDKTEAPVIGDSAVAMAHQAMDALTKRYQFTPKGPILIEIFPKHDDFAVRNVGIPGMIGALGACFGRVVTMDSPHARPPGEFQWEATLWHELAHVITIQMSNQRVPRWLTEGISVYEEKIARPEWARGQDLEWVHMLNRNEAMKLADLNAAFTDPRKISIAYFEASLLVQHLVERYGDEGLHKLLRAYGQGLDTDAALKASVNTTLAEMQDGFDKFNEREFGKLQAALKEPDKGVDLPRMPIDDLKAYVAKNEGSFIAQMALGIQLQKAGDLDGAVAAFKKASALVPIATGDDSPEAMLAEIALRKKDNAAAIEALKAQVDTDFNNVDAARQLAGLLKTTGVTDPARLEPVYQRIVSIDPFDAESRAGYGRALMQAHKPDEATREFKAVVAMHPVDQAAAYTDLAESYYQSGKRADARKQTLAALEVAPSYERAQDLLLKLSEARP